MKFVLLKCQDCGCIMCVNQKELWKVGSCTTCGNWHLVNLDEEFDNIGVLDE